MTDRILVIEDEPGIVDFLERGLRAHGFEVDSALDYRTESLLVAPLGVKAAHAMSKRTLEMAFGSYLFIVGSRFVISLVSGQ